MNRPSVLVPLLIIVNACLWALAMVMSAYALQGTGLYGEIQPVLGGCAAGSVLLVGAGLAGAVRKAREEGAQGRS